MLAYVSLRGFTNQPTNQPTNQIPTTLDIWYTINRYIYIYPSVVKKNNQPSEATNPLRTSLLAPKILPIKLEDDHERFWLGGVPSLNVGLLEETDGKGWYKGEYCKVFFK